MLQPIKHVLKQKKIILASGSPRRRELVENIGLTVELCPSLFEENLDPKTFSSFSAFVEETALQKVVEVEHRLKSQGRPPDVVIGADTMVTLDGEMFGKPTSETEAFEMLKSLSGRCHTVYTGVVVKVSDKVVKFTERTNVVFGKLDDEQIKGYIATGEPIFQIYSDKYHKYRSDNNSKWNSDCRTRIPCIAEITSFRRDKAGGYGIQGVGGTFVERVEGDYFTVVGLPLYRLCSVLYELFKENK